MRKWLLYMSFFVTCCISCDMVDFPVPVNNQPVFFAKGKIDGNNVNWVAGDNGYFMHTQIIKSSIQTLLKGRFSKEECRDLCPESLQLSMQIDSNFSTSSPTFFSTGLKQLKTDLERDKMQFSYSTKIESRGLPDPIENFQIGDVKILKASTTLVQKANSNFNYLITFPNYFSLLIESSINARVGEFVLPTFKIDDNEKRILLSVNNDLIKTINWSNSSAENTIELTRNPAGRVVCKVEMKSGATVIYTFDYKEGSNKSGFTFIASLITNVNKIISAENPSQNQSLLVEYMDADGRYFNSKSIGQNQSKVEFRISEPYERDGFGNKTQKINCLISCDLKEANGDRIVKVENMEMVIALPYQ